MSVGNRRFACLPASQTQHLFKNVNAEPFAGVLDNKNAGDCPPCESVFPAGICGKVSVFALQRLQKIVQNNFDARCRSSIELVWTLEIFSGFRV